MGARGVGVAGALDVEVPGDGGHDLVGAVEDFEHAAVHVFENGQALRDQRHLAEGNTHATPTTGAGKQKNEK